MTSSLLKYCNIKTRINNMLIILFNSFQRYFFFLHLKFVFTLFVGLFGVKRKIVTAQIRNKLSDVNVMSQVVVVSKTIGYNVLRLGEGGDFTTNFNTKHNTSNLRKTVIRSTAPPLLPNRCSSVQQS